MSNPMAHAVRQWVQLLGKKFVLNDELTIIKYSRTTGDVGTRPLAILYPISTEEVQEIVRIASHFKIALYPISRGKNYGYGDACAATDNQVILDFKRMSRILEVNPRLGFALIEPGVTQGQLSDYLRKNKTGLWMDATGAGPQASVVGNALERGCGHTHYGDHFKTMCGLEVVLADGQVLKTGFGHLPKARATQVYPHGIGPSLEGLFAQSNFGIVTKMGFWLSPEPETFSAFICQLKTEGELLHAIDILSGLKMRGVLQSTVHIGNDIRLISTRGRFPWDDAGAATLLPEELRERLRKKYQAPLWIFTGAIYGSKETVKATRSTIKKALLPHKIKFIDDRRFDRGNYLHKLMTRTGLARFHFAQNLRQQLDMMKPLYELLKGIPSVETLKGAAWRTRDPLPSGSYEPLEAGSGILWLTPVLPATSENVKEVLGLIQPVFAQYGLDCPVTFAMINDRALICVTNIFFDKKNSTEAARAIACHSEVGRLLEEQGYYSYRSSAQGSANLHVLQSPYWETLRKIKQALDPHRILSPGHYVPND